MEAENRKCNQDLTANLLVTCFKPSTAFEKMGFLMIVLFSFCYLLCSPKTASATTFNLMSYGAKGDGKTDDSKAFIRAWADLCRDKSPNPTLIIPPGKTFSISPVAFNGPCKSHSVHIKLLGKITAPKTLKGWTGCFKEFWISFAYVQGLTIDGPGQIDGQGSVWWRKQVRTKTCDHPSALHFHKCDGLRLRGTTHINSPRMHISINDCKGVDVGNLRILAPGDSPNTDGIDISSSSHVSIHDSTIKTGDDCVAINGGTYDINVTRVFCGPGHGISIGSLGENGGHDTVEQVQVKSCNITGTKNGLRIKTVPYGTGYARGIVFRDINLVNVENPIIIDQHYCTNYEYEFCPSPPSAPAVKVSDVTYTNVHGSSATKQAITFNCSGKFKCTGIQTTNVGISGNGDFAFCQNAQGRFVATSPRVTCT